MRKARRAQEHNEEMKITHLMKAQESLISVFPRITEIPSTLKRLQVIQQGAFYKKELDDMVQHKLDSARALKANELQMEARQKELVSRQFE